MQPGDLDQEKCVEMLQLIVDEQASQEQIAFFKEHVAICKSCLDNYTLDNAIKKALQTKLESKCCPDEVVNRIKAAISSEA